MLTEIAMPTLTTVGRQVANMREAIGEAFDMLSVVLGVTFAILAGSGDSIVPLGARPFTLHVYEYCSRNDAGSFYNHKGVPGGGERNGVCREVFI
jgi:hypothetical protein